MKIKKDLVEGIFVEKLDHFTANVTLEGETVKAYIPSLAKIDSLLVSGQKVILGREIEEGGAISHDLISICLENQLISVDTRLPLKFVEELLTERQIPELKNYSLKEREIFYSGGRLDFLLQGKTKKDKCYLEVESISLAKGKTALFHPTEWGVKHLNHLISAKKEGYRSVLFLLIQRDDVNSLTFNPAAAPKFKEKIKEAIESGVEVMAYSCHITPQEITLAKKIPVNI